MNVNSLQRLKAGAVRDFSTGKYIGVLVNSDNQQVVETTALSYPDQRTAAESAYFLLVIAAQFYMGN